MIFDKEVDFENAVIQRLVDAGWVNHLTNQPEILRYKTEKDLIQNWADILYENNNTIDRLNGKHLTSGEMEQILEQVKSITYTCKFKWFYQWKSCNYKER